MHHTSDLYSITSIADKLLYVNKLIINYNQLFLIYKIKNVTAHIINYIQVNYLNIKCNFLQNKKYVHFITMVVSFQEFFFF